MTQTPQSSLLLHSLLPDPILVVSDYVTRYQNREVDHLAGSPRNSRHQARPQALYVSAFRLSFALSVRPEPSISW